MYTHTHSFTKFKNAYVQLDRRFSGNTTENKTLSIKIVWSLVLCMLTIFGGFAVTCTAKNYSFSWVVQACTKSAAQVQEIAVPRSYQVSVRQQRVVGRGVFVLYFRSTELPQLILIIRICRISLGWYTERFEVQKKCNPPPPFPVIRQ